MDERTHNRPTELLVHRENPLWKVTTDDDGADVLVQLRGDRALSVKMRGVSFGDVALVLRACTTAQVIADGLSPDASLAISVEARPER